MGGSSGSVCAVSLFCLVYLKRLNIPSVSVLSLSLSLSLSL